MPHRSLQHAKSLRDTSTTIFIAFGSIRMRGIVRTPRRGYSRNEAAAVGSNRFHAIDTVHMAWRIKGQICTDIILSQNAASSRTHAVLLLAIRGRRETVGRGTPGGLWTGKCSDLVAMHPSEWYINLCKTITSDGGHLNGSISRAFCDIRCYFHLRQAPSADARR